MRDPDARVTWYLSHSPDRAGYCANHVMRALDTPPQGIPDATAMYHRTAAHGPIRRGPAPKGAIGYWTGGVRGHGHVAIVAGDATETFASVDVAGPATVGVRRLPWFERNWPRLNYRGWSWWWGSVNTQPEEDDVKGHRDYTGKVSKRTPLVVDGKWHRVPDLRTLKGSPFSRPDETHSLYLRVYPAWTEDSTPMSIELRWMRSNGDATGHDEEQYELGPGATSIPMRGWHDELGSKGVGGWWEYRVEGEGFDLVAGTRYAKLKSLDVDWVD